MIHRKNPLRSEPEGASSIGCAAARRLSGRDQAAVSSAAISSAICAVLSAAPLRRLSPHTNSSSSFGVTDVGLDPVNLDVVYASAFDAGVWRRDAGAGQTLFGQVFAPQFNQGAGIDRTMFALTVKNGHTRIYLTDGTANGGGISGTLASNFWRTDNANATGFGNVVWRPQLDLGPSMSIRCGPSIRG